MVGRIVPFDADIQRTRKLLDQLVEAADRETDKDNRQRLRDAAARVAEVLSRKEARQ